MANGYQAIQDPFGLGRLTQQIRLNRKDAREAPLREARAELLQGQVQQQRQGLADMARNQQESVDLRTTIEASPDEDTDFTTLKFLQKRNPAKAQELMKNIFTNVGQISKLNPQAGVEMFNKKTGSNIKYIGQEGKYTKLDLGDKVVLYDGSSDQIVREFPKAQDSGEVIETMPDGSVRITRGGGSEIPKKLKSDLSSSIANNEQNLSRLDRLAEQYKPAFLTYKGSIGSKISSLKSKAGIDLSNEEKKFLGERRKFTQNINQLFNAYRKEITGAAASVQELESLKKAMLSDDLSPAEFEASYDEFRSELLRANRISRRLLREGIEEGFGKRFDDIFTSGGDDDIETRGEELQKLGLKPEDLADRLIAEGYE